MAEFLDFFLAAQSGDAFLKVLIAIAAGLLLAVLFTFSEYRAKTVAWLFVMANAFLAAVLAAVLLVLGAGLSELLLGLLGLLLVRVLFIFAKERDKT